MNIILLEPDEIGQVIPRADRRWEHVRKVLGKGPGAFLAAGVVDGPLGTATILALDDRGLVLDFRKEREAPPLAPLRLLLGFPRPIQATRILRELASLGVAEILLCGTALGEKSYLESAFFQKGAWRRPLLEGAEQAGNPRLPAVSRHRSLERALDALAETGSAGEGRVFLHPAPGIPLLGSLEPGPAADGAAANGAVGGRSAWRLTLAVGSERGWTPEETGLLAARGFLAMSLGERILRSETASVAAVAIALGKLGLI